MYTINIIGVAMSKGCNFSVKLNPRHAGKKSAEEQSAILIKRFLRKWKQSGILKELKEKSYPQTKGMKERKKRYLGKRRNNRELSR
jgi:hypothetical protein